MRAIAIACAGAVAATLTVGAAKMKVRADADPGFDFRTVRTWAWHEDGPGEVKMARSAEDDPAPIQRRFGPTIAGAVIRELAARKLTEVADAPDVRVHYYLLITVGFDTQQTGQFLPSVPAWGVPPFAPATMSYSIIQTGSIVLDVVSTRLARIVWRGVAQTEIEQQRSDEQRDVRVREAIRDLIRKFPAK
jgi:Domain of unknown function (DUF4136)